MAEVISKSRDPQSAAPAPAAARSRLFLIDSYGFIFRAYHARARSAAPPMRTTTGLMTEAVYIFHNMLRKLRAAYHPEYIAAVFESGKTFRETTLYADYKANRTEMPPDLREQIPYIRRLLEVMRIPILQYEGFEADDVIGAIAARASDAHDVVIVSSDKDMLQLVNEHVNMYNPVKEDIWYDPATAEQFMGVKPGQVADMLALMGDSVDNIPGAPGIGEKGARDLIQRFGSVEAAIDHAAEVERKTYRESLQNNRDQILLSKRLAAIDTTVPIEFRLQDLAAQEPDLAALKKIYRELEFYSLLKELAPVEDFTRDYRVLADREEAAAYAATLRKLDPSKPVAFAIQSAPEGELALTMLGVSFEAGVARALSTEYLEELRPILEDPQRIKIADDIKSLLLALANHGVEAQGFRHDMTLYAFLLCADPAACTPENLAERYLDRKLGAAAEQHADLAFTLAERLVPEIDAQGFRQIYEEIDLPLASVLARMERIGIRIEPHQLKVLSEQLETSIQQLSEEIYQLAGKPFNINSPAQLGKILFEEMNLPAPVKYGKGKTISTAADVLEGLAGEHEIARKVLEYRQLAKLKGTYIDALPALIDPRTGRLHTTFNQAGAATGRLSSSNPNLQNIPIRTELGREIRAAFVPQQGWKLVVADYSQIELRLLAHMSHDPVLVKAFRNGEDIHTRTAAEVFHVLPMLVTPEMRRNAKAVNFGIVYGQTPFGLATSLGIDRKEAEAYIHTYFELHAGVRKFIQAATAEVREKGYALTLFGRKRPIPDMHSRNPNARSFAERTAVNTPLQGTAADLIKVAMIRIDEILRRENWQTRMLLQVHDELLFESPPSEAEKAAKMVKREMESVYKLEVPLVVDVGIGDNWRDAK
ncbi:MAG TPA: DNA polymerase I [Bryobacteraceae bacterium]|nr:DNA polymerase I [Bryobacteraceae bacterium]